MQALQELRKFDIPPMPTLIKLLEELEKPSVSLARKILLAQSLAGVAVMVEASLAATGGSVPKPGHASGATGMGKGPNDGGITGAQSEVKASPAETGSRGEDQEPKIGVASTGGSSENENMRLNVRE